MLIYIAHFMHQAPLTRTSLKQGRQTAILGHRKGHKPANTAQALGSDPITGTGSTSQLVGLHLRNPSLMDYYSFTVIYRTSFTMYQRSCAFVSDRTSHDTVLLVA